MTRCPAGSSPGAIAGAATSAELWFGVIEAMILVATVAGTHEPRLNQAFFFGGGGGIMMFLSALRTYARDDPNRAGLEVTMYNYDRSAHA